jgi:hypothetical protein
LSRLTACSGKVPIMFRENGCVSNRLRVAAGRYADETPPLERGCQM